MSTSTANNLVTFFPLPVSWTVHKSSAILSLGTQNWLEMPTEINLSVANTLQGRGSYSGPQYRNSDGFITYIIFTHMKLEVLKLVTMQITIALNVTPHNLANKHQYFGET